jgi:high-affinity Fe2+/Pb2+ permease
MRNSHIYLGIAIVALFLASRLVTVALMLVHAPEDAAQYFFLKQTIFSVIAAGLIVWLWSKRNRESTDESSEGGE